MLSLAFCLAWEALPSRILLLSLAEMTLRLPGYGCVPTFLRVGSKSMPHFGHVPGLLNLSERCIGQEYTRAAFGGFARPCRLRCASAVGAVATTTTRSSAAR